jgi:hypothetical protein
MSYEPEEYVPRQRFNTAKTTVPGVFLIIIGILNALVAVYLLFIGFQVMNTPAADLERVISAQQRKQLQEMEKAGYTMEQIKQIVAGVYFGLGGVGAVAGLLILLGGVSLVTLRAYGLGITGAILAMIPCISPLACILVGVGIGIWALVVLLSADVRSVFGRGSSRRREADAGPDAG